MSKFMIAGIEHNINIRKLPLLGSGTRGNVFSYEEKALKIFHKKFKTMKPVQYQTLCNNINNLTEVKVDRWTFPEEAVLKNNKTVGYLSEEITNLKPLYMLQYLSIDKLIEESHLLREGYRFITEDYGLQICDARARNVVFNDSIYMTDTDQYISNRGYYTKEELMFLNKISMEDLLYELLFNEAYDRSYADFYRYAFGTKYNEFKSKYKDKQLFISDFIEHISEKNQINCFEDIPPCLKSDGHQKRLIF